VIVLNGQDEENQPLAASYWDIVLALDPHRFLIMPGIHLRQDDPRKRVDHLTKFEGGLGLALVQTIYDAADTQVYCNPEHDPTSHVDQRSPRLPRPWTTDGAPASGPEYLLQYDVLRPGYTVERRWLDEHLPASDTLEGPPNQ
jgi:hypothetical protein